MTNSTILVTGGAGFIGSAVIRFLINETKHRVVNYDALTYAGNLASLESVNKSTRYHFLHANICDIDAVKTCLEKFKPMIIMHLAAESHVDRSIDSPSTFIDTNIMGTFQLLQAARNYYDQLDNEVKEHFRFHHISTDEVFGDLTNNNDYFTESTAYAPSSPYSASKAASDHLVKAWQRTYQLPCVISNCSNNYGPFHFPEKLIPHMILTALEGKALPVYGDGQQVRDWLYVEDHARALYLVATQGKIGETYNIGGHNEKTNLEVVNTICELLDQHIKNKPNDIGSFKSLIHHVSDRPGHDRRYAIDASKIAKELAWQPQENFVSGLTKTVQWYLDNKSWWQNILSGQYHLQRIGTQYD